jgi:predicted AAA+ superfamily ATPase
VLSTLSETYIIALMTPFHRNPITELKKTPKVYFLDQGLRNYILNDFNTLDRRVDSGALAEDSVYLNLRNTFPESKLNYWRTIAKAEVDFVLTTRDEHTPVEVKYQNLDEPKISRSLRSFIDTYKPRRALVATKNFWAKTQIGKTEILHAPACYI